MLCTRAFAGGVLLFLFQSSFADETLRGVVVENNMEDPDIGAYLHIVAPETNKRFFVIYSPKDDNDDECPTRIHAYWITKGDMVEVRGTVLQEAHGEHFVEHVLTTCTKDSYIRRIAKGGADTTAQK